MPPYGIIRGIVQSHEVFVGQQGTETGQPASQATEGITQGKHFNDTWSTLASHAQPGSMHLKSRTCHQHVLVVLLTMLMYNATHSVQLQAAEINLTPHMVHGNVASVQSRST